MGEFYPPVAFYFKVSFSGLSASEASFQEVSGIGAEMETETVREGGENNFVWDLPKGVKHGNLELKRGLVTKWSSLYNWCRSSLMNDFTVPIEPRKVQVFLLNAEGEALNSWSFQNAYPVKWSLSEFNSTKNDIVVESISLRYTTMTKDS